MALRFLRSVSDIMRPSSIDFLLVNMARLEVVFYWLILTGGSLGRGATLSLRSESRRAEELELQASDEFADFFLLILWED